MPEDKKFETYEVLDVVGNALKKAALALKDDNKLSVDEIVSLAVSIAQEAIAEMND